VARQLCNQDAFLAGVAKLQKQIRNADLRSRPSNPLRSGITRVSQTWSFATGETPEAIAAARQLIIFHGILSAFFCNVKLLNSAHKPLPSVSATVF
jgi:hypothetical protein